MKKICNLTRSAYVKVADRVSKIMPFQVLPEKFPRFEHKYVNPLRESFQYPESGEGSKLKSAALVSSDI